MSSPMKLQIQKMQLHKMETLALWRTDLHHSQCMLRHSHPCTSLQHKLPPQRHLPSPPLQSQQACKRFALTYSGSIQPGTNDKYSQQKTSRRGTESQMYDCQRLDFHLELACMLSCLACQNTDLWDIVRSVSDQPDSGRIHESTSYTALNPQTLHRFLPRICRTPLMLLMTRNTQQDTHCI